MLGIRGLELLEASESLEQNCDSPTTLAESVLQQLIQADAERDQRQLHLVDRHGHTAAWTGQDCVDWAGHLLFPQFSVAGNMLVGEAVLQAMADTYQQAKQEPLSHRLLLALEAGDAAGGDKRGRQSAVLLVMGTDPYPHLDLRVDHHEQAIAMLRTLYEESCKEYYQSFRRSMPSVKDLNQ